MLYLVQISSDLQTSDGGASDSEGSDISGIDEYIYDHFDGETDGFRHKFTPVKALAGVKALAQPGVGHSEGCQTGLVSLTSLTKHDLKALTPTG